MSTKNRVFKKLAQENKTELSAQKVELSLMDDVDKALDKANSKRRNLEKLAKKVSSDFNELQSEYAIALRIAKKGEAAAKEIGADDLRKFFGNRGDEAKDYQNEVGKAANKIFSAVSSI
jgi:hypothetical protein